MTTTKKRGSKKESFMQGILALMFSQVLIKILGLLYKLYLTNREGFGDSGNAIYSGGYQIYALLLTLSSIGVPNAISKMVSERIAAEDPKGAQRVFKIAFLTFAIIGFVGTLILFLGAKVIATSLLQIPEAEYTLMALSPSIFFVSIASVIRGYFNGTQKMSATANSQTFEQLFKTIFTIVAVELVVMISGINTTLMAAGATIATTLATFLSFAYLYLYYKRNRLKINPEQKSAGIYGKASVRTIIKNILLVSIPISLSSLLSAVNKNIDSFTVVRGLKPIIGEKLAKEQYGILSGKVDTLTSLPLAFNIAFATALVPAISSARIKGDTQTINKRISFSLLITILIGLPCTIGMCIFAPQILLLLFPKASSGGLVLAISALTIIFTMIAQTINGALQGLGKVTVPATALGIGVFVKFIINVKLIPVLGVNAASLGSVVCHLVSCVIGYNVLKRSVKLNFKLRTLIIKPIIASILMGGISYAIYYGCNFILPERIAIIIGIISAVLIYACLVFVMRIIPEEEIDSLPFGEKLHKVLIKLHIY